MPLTFATVSPYLGCLAVAALAGCSGKATETGPPGATTSPTTTPPTDTDTDSDTGPDLDLTNGALELRYGFDGFPAGIETCADVGTKTLWLDISFGGAVEPSAELPCDDEPILLIPGEVGTYLLQLATVSPLHDGSGTYGESYAIYAETEPGELTDVYVPIVCYSDGALCK